MPEAITGIKLDDLEAVLKEESATAITNQVNEVVPVANTAEPEAVVESDHKWVKAVTLFLQSAGIDINIDEPQWKQSLEVAVQTFSELDEDNQNNFRIDAYTWLTEWLSNPQSSLADALSTEAVIHFIAIFSQARFLRKSAQNKQLEQFKDKLNNLNREAIKPAQPDEPASEPATPAAETGKTPEELAAERETWKKQVQDFFDSVGLKGSHLINLSKDNQDSAILSLQKKDPQARQQLLTEAEAWLAQPLDVLRIDLNESHQQQALAVLVIETTSLTQAQRAQLNKLRVALLVAQDPTSSLLINQLDRIHSANKKAIVEALRVQLTEDEPSDGLMRDICQVLSTLAIKDSGGAAGVPAVDALQSLEKTHWGVIVQYLEQITTGAARTDTAAQALQVIARHEDSARWQRVVDIALDPSTQLGVRNKAVEYLVENKEWDMVKTFVERAGGRKELKTVVGFAQRSLEGAGVVTPSNAPEFVASDEEVSPAAPASPAPELHSPPPEPPPSFDSDPTGFSVNYYGTIFNLDQGVRLGMLQDIPRLKADMTPEQVKSVLTTGKDPVPTPEIKASSPDLAEKISLAFRNQQLLRPSDTADLLGISAATLRRYSFRISGYLEVPSEASGRGSQRRYNENDVRVLARAHKLIEQGWTYEQVNGQLAKPESEDPVAEPAASSTSETADSLPGSRLQAAVGVLRELSQAENPDPLEPNVLGNHLSALIVAMEVDAESRGEVEALIEAYRKKVQPEAVIPTPEESTREKTVASLTNFLMVAPEGSLPADPERARQVADFFIDALGEEHYPSQLFLDTLEGQDFATLGMTEEKYAEFFKQVDKKDDHYGRPIDWFEWRFSPIMTLSRLRELMVNEGILLSKENYLVLLESQVAQALASFFTDGHSERANTDQVAQAVLDSIIEWFDASKTSLIDYLRKALTHAQGISYRHIELRNLGIGGHTFAKLADRLSQLHPAGRTLGFTYTDTATFGDLRTALVDQGFLDAKAVAAEPSPGRPEPASPPGSHPEPTSEAMAEFDGDFDLKTTIEGLTKSEGIVGHVSFAEGRTVDQVDSFDLATIAYSAYLGLLDDDNLDSSMPNRVMNRFEADQTAFQSCRSALFSPDADVDALIKQMSNVVQACLAGDEFNPPVQFLEGKTPEMGQKRLAAVIRKLHDVIISRQQVEKPVEELEKASEFDPKVVAEELAKQIFPPELALENVTPAQLTVVVTVSYFEAIENNRQFGLYCDTQLNRDRANFFRCRDILYDPEANIQDAIELLNKVVDSVVEVGGETLHEGANLQVSRDRLAAVLTELHRILSKRQSHAEPVPVMELRGQPFKDTLNATELDGDIRRYLDRLVEREDMRDALERISKEAQSPEIRAYAAELLEKRKPAGRLPEEIAELAAANRAILIEHAATLLGHNMYGSEAIEGQSRWDTVFFELKAQIEKVFDFNYSDKGKERLRTIVFGIFNNLDAMENDDILNMFPEQRGEGGELCAYGFDIEDEQSQRDTVEYLIEIAAINGIRFLTDLRRYYGQRFANLTYKLSSENKLSYTPNGERLLKGEASALHFVASVAGINFLAEKGLLTDELLKNADIKTIEKFIQQKRWWDALEVSAIQNQEKSEQKNRLVFTALMDEYGPDFTEEEKAAILKIDSTLLFSQIHTILDLPHAGIDDVLHYEHWQRRFESLCLSLSQACGYGQNAELPAQFNQALNNFMSRIFREEVVVQLTPAERDLPQRIVGVLKTARLTSKLNWVRMRWGLRVDAIDMGLKFSLIRASDVPEVAEAKLAEAEMAGAEEDGDEKASALEEIRDFGLDPSSFETETDEDRATMWATVADAFAELRDLPDDQVDQVAADLAIGLGALGTAGVLPPEELCDDIPYNQATDNLYKLYAQLEAGQEINPELARRALFTFWRSFWSADLPSSEAEMNSFIDKYQETLAVFLGVFAQEGWLNQM